MSRKGDGAEEALPSREQEPRLLAETIPTAVWRAAPEGNVEYVRSNLRRLTTRSADFEELMANIGSTYVVSRCEPVMAGCLLPSPSTLRNCSA
jgi:hypothetical protein